MRLLLLFATASLGVAARAADRPNIIYLMTDDQCTRSLGCYGAPGAKTPNIDRLASRGVVFDRHYDTTAICMASRATVMTGLLEYRHGVNFGRSERGGDTHMTPEHWASSYPMRMREAGYRTAFAGKFGFVIADGSKKGRYPSDDFDRWGGGPGQTNYVTAKNASMKDYAKEYPHATRSYGAFGSDFVQDSVAAGEPFCLSISFKAPHYPVQPDPVFDDVYKGATFPKAANYGRENGLHFAEQSRQGRQYARFIDWGYATEYDAVMAKYYQLIYAVDVAVGMIVDAVEQAGATDNTVVVFTSDNGFFCGAHGYGSKVLPYEESTRVPLIIVDPTRERGAERSNSLTGNIDLAPTILELAGLKSEDEIDGTSLVPVYTGAETRDGPMPLMNVWGPKECYCLGVVNGRWKYVYWPYEGRGMRPTAELYDLKSDPLELANLLNDPAAKSGRSEMEEVYDFMLEDWSEQAAGHGGYRELLPFFQRRGAAAGD